MRFFGQLIDFFIKFAAVNDEKLEYLLLIIVLLIWLAVWQYRKMETLRQNVANVLEIVDNDDFMFRYSTAKTIDKKVNAYLNKLIEAIEKKTDEARLKEQYFEVIINCVETGILVVDNRGIIRQSNNAARKLLHRNVLTNIKFLDLDSLKNMNILTSRMKIHDKQLTIYALNDMSKTLEEKELESWEKLTRVLTHEIMNSITPMTSLSDTLLNMKDPTPEKIHDSLVLIKETGDGLMKFVNNYRSFTNVPRPCPSLVDVQPFLEKMIELTRHQYPDSDVSFSLKVDPIDMIVYADENLTARVVLNILKNAVEALEVGKQKKSKISITARLDQSEAIYIDISNNGPLISDVDSEQIFVPFYSTRENGSGIGLSLAKRIMQESGGQLTLQNKPETKFTIIFP